MLKASVDKMREIKKLRQARKARRRLSRKQQALGRAGSFLNHRNVCQGFLLTMQKLST